MSTDAARELLANTTLTWTVQQEDLLRYAGIARDFNKIHYDDAAAREHGFDRPIAHGMLNLGLVLTRVVDVVGVKALRSSTTRFSAPAYVGSELTLTFAAADGGAVMATITDDVGQRVLGAEILLDDVGGRPPAQHAEPGGELVAERWFVVEQGPVTRFAATLGASSEYFHRKDAAEAAGFPSIPALPTYGFVLPSWGFFPELAGNEKATMPDAVRDSQAWAQTDRAVVHAGQAFTFSSPLLVGTLVRARTTVVSRASKQRADRSLRFTDAHSVMTDSSGAHILTSATTLVVSD